MNRVVLVGRLTRDPELRTTASGVSQARFTLAVNRRVANEEGQHEADFINCVAWRGLADTIYKYFKKGKEIALEGRIQTSSYEDKHGDTRWQTDVVVDNITFIGSKDQERDSKADIKENKEVKEDPFEDLGDLVELDDSELPF